MGSFILLSDLDFNFERSLENGNSVRGQKKRALIINNNTYLTFCIFLCYCKNTKSRIYNSIFFCTINRPENLRAGIEARKFTAKQVISPEKLVTQTRKIRGFHTKILRVSIILKISGYKTPNF